MIPKAIKPMKGFCLLVVFQLFAVVGFSQNHITFTLTNATSTANTLEYDIYIVNDGTTSLKLAAVSMGINYSESILNGATPGTGAYVYIPDTRDPVFSTIPNYSVQHTLARHHLRVTTTNSTIDNAVTLPFNVPIMLGRFRFTNTTSWVANSNPNLAMQLVTAGGYTQMAAVVFANGATTTTGLATTGDLPLGNRNGVVSANITLNPTVSCNVSGVASNLQPATCEGGTGSADITLSGDGSDASGTYTVDGGEPVAFSSNPFTITGLSAGPHTVVTTTGECTSSDINFTITAPAAFNATYTVTDRSVCGENFDGAIALDVTGGSGNYNYAWSGVTGSGNPATTPFPDPGNVSSITGLNYGFYNVTITDAGGCGVVTFNDIHVKWAHPPVITHNGEASSSCGNTGTLIIYASAGVAPYTYSADGVDYQESNTITGLAAGPMTIYVKDAAGCIATKDYTVLSAPALTIDPYVVAASGCNDDGSIKIYRTGGIPPYTYSVDGSPFLTSNLFTGIAAGTHTATVKDSKGCEASVEVTVGQGIGLTATISRKSNTTACVNNGSFQVSVTGGVGPFTYSLDGGEPQSSNSFTGLGAGNYVVTVTDSRGCTGTANVTINVSYIGITTYVVDAPNCSGTGSVKLMPAGGSSPYTYSLDGDNYQTSPWFYNLAPGTYTGFIKDNNTCVGQTTEGGIIVGPGDCNQATRGTKVVTAETLASVRAFPNPSVNDFTVDLKGFNMNEKVMITVTDLLGRKVYQTEGTGMMQYKIGSRLLSGMYNVTIVQGEKHFALKVVKE